MEIRRMTQEEYQAIPDREPLDRLPSDSVVIGAFNGGHLIGRTCLLNMLHLEGTWISPGSRGGFVGARMIEEAERQANEIGVTTVLAYTANPKHGEYMKRLGYEKIDVEVWGKKGICH